MPVLSPHEIIQVTRCGKTFRASRRTVAHIDYTMQRLAKERPGATLRIVQGSYNTGVDQSAGTHDYDAVLDLVVTGISWWDAQWFLRCCGWAAWYRHTGSWARSSAWHIHMISLGYETRVGIFVPGQVKDYYAHSMGLAGQHAPGLDSSPFPENIADTVFDYYSWMEDQMGYKDWPQEDKDALLTDLLNAKVDGNVSLRQAVKQAANVPAMVRKLAKGLKVDIGEPK